MSPAWTPERQALARRRKNGTFKAWPGGRPDKRDSSFKGIHIHNAADFRAQNGRPAKVGDIVRHRDNDGTYHEQAQWYVKTKFGWRKSTTGTRKPTASEVKKINNRSRQGGKR